MILACPQCGKRYRTDPARIPPGGGFVRCPGCRARIEVRPPEPSAPHAPPAPVEPSAPAAAPAPSPPSAVPEAAPPPPAAAPSPPAPAPSPIQVVRPPAPETRRSSLPPPEVFIRTDGGSYIARDLEEVRTWVLQGRLLREDLISHAGGPEVRADLHPLTRHFFVLMETHEAMEPVPPAAVEAPSGAVEAAPALSSDAAAQEIAPLAAAASDAMVAGAVTSEPAADAAAAATPADEAQAAALAQAPEGEEPGRLPGSVRAIGILNFLLCLFPAINPVGLAAAFGLLRGRAWGRALTLFWAMTSLLALVLAAVGFARGTIDRDALHKLAPKLPWDLLLTTAAVIAGMLAVYLLVSIVHLSRRRVAERFRGGGSLAAVLLALIIYFALGGFIANGGVKDRIRHFLPRLAAPRLPPAPRVTAPVPAPAPVPPAEITEGRAFTADGLASLEVAPGWKVRKVTEGEEAKLGLRLHGERSVPAGTMRLIAATPADLEKQDQRFDRVDTQRGDIKDVEVIRRGDFTGRKIVTEFPVSGGVNGYIVLSLHDSDQGYQFRCGSKGPFFETIRPECERMAASVLISDKSAAPAAPTAGQASPTSGSPPARTTSGVPSPAGAPATPDAPATTDSGGANQAPPAGSVTPPAANPPANP